MPSSPTVEPAVQTRSCGVPMACCRCWTRLPDPRRRRGVRHRVAGIVAVALTAVLAGARSYAAIASWAADLSVEQRAQVGLTRPGAPDASTFRRVLGRLDAVVLDAVVGAFVWTRTATVERAPGDRAGRQDRARRPHHHRCRNGSRAASGGRVRPGVRDRARATRRSPRRATKSPPCERFWPGST